MPDTDDLTVKTQLDIVLYRLEEVQKEISMIDFYTMNGEPEEDDRDRLDVLRHELGELLAKRRALLEGREDAGR